MSGWEVDSGRDTYCQMRRSVRSRVRMSTAHLCMGMQVLGWRWPPENGASESANSNGEVYSPGGEETGEEVEEEEEDDVVFVMGPPGQQQPWVSTS